MDVYLGVWHWKYWCVWHLKTLISQWCLKTCKGICESLVIFYRETTEIACKKQVALELKCSEIIYFHGAQFLWIHESQYKMYIRGDVIFVDIGWLV